MSGGISRGMNAMWMGMRFWLMMPMAITPHRIPHLALRAILAWLDSSAFFIRTMIQLASSRGRPEWATAMANAPSSA